MNIGEFVEESLKQIIDAVARAQRYAHREGAAINPPRFKRVLKRTSDGMTATDRREARKLDVIEFDIAVGSDESSSREGGAGVRVAGFQFGGKADGAITNSSLSHVRFTVDVEFPEQWSPRDEKGATASGE